MPAPTNLFRVLSANTHDAATVWPILGIVEDDETTKCVATESAPYTDMKSVCERNTVIPRCNGERQEPQS